MRVDICPHLRHCPKYSWEAVFGRPRLMSQKAHHMHQSYPTQGRTFQGLFQISGLCRCTQRDAGDSIMVGSSASLWLRYIYPQWLLCEVGLRYCYYYKVLSPLLLLLGGVLVYTHRAFESCIHKGFWTVMIWFDYGWNMKTLWISHTTLSLSPEVVECIVNLLLSL